MPATPTAQEIEDRIYDAIVSFGPDRSEITRDATLESLEVDSLDLIELSQIVQQEFGVHLDGGDIKDIRTVGDAIDMVAARTS